MQLSNGAEIDFDWSAISQKEWRILINKETNDATNDQIVGKLVGMTGDELTDLSPVDYRRIANGLFESFKDAIDTSTSKNLVGASTSD